MVFLFSERNSREEEEITEILCRNGAGITATGMPPSSASFPLFIIRNPDILEAANGVAIFTSDCRAFSRRALPFPLTGVCEQGNHTALSIFKRNQIPAVVCGMDHRNTLTLSSVSEGAVLAGLQRSLTDKNGREIPPAEYPVTLSGPYCRFAVLASAAALLFEGFSPESF